jgi:hypothetical protein
MGERMVRVERIASPNSDAASARGDAIALLKRIAAGTAPTRTTQEAAAVLKRLDTSR